jgi:hypothetical protein
MLTKKHYKTYIKDFFWNHYSLYKISNCKKLKVTYVRVSMLGVEHFPWFFYGTVMGLLAGGGPITPNKLKRSRQRKGVVYYSNVNRINSVKFFFIVSHYSCLNVFFKQWYRPRMALIRSGSTMYRFDLNRCFFDHNMKNFYRRFFKEYFYIPKIFFFGGVNRRFVIEVLKFSNFPALVKLRYFYLNEPKSFSLYRYSFFKYNF